ncbi:MAG: trigger factor [Alphaproteobacteria bacterium]
MQVVEGAVEGLKRELKVVVPATDIDGRVSKKMDEVGKNVRIPGFRPGKVPAGLLKKRYGAAVMNEVMEEVVSDSASKAMEEKGLRPALQPKIQVDSFGEGKDLAYTMSVEVLPEIQPMDFAKLELTKYKVEVPADKIEEQLTKVAEGRKQSEPVTDGRAAQNGDIAVIDFVGRQGGVEFKGGAGKDYFLELGSNHFIPGFEEQLVGVKAGEHRQVKVTFPAEYGAKELAGKEAEFSVDVKEIRAAKPAEINDELAKTLGMENVAALRDAVKKQMENEYNSLARSRLKRELLDALNEHHKFEVPSGMVDLEFDAIWKQIEEQRKQGQSDSEDAGKSDDELKAEYRKIAERRVRLGLLLSEVGTKNNISVPQEEITRAIFQEAQRFPGQERQVVEYFQKNPQAVNSVRAPLFEEKVIDFILELAKLTDKSMTLEELIKEGDDDAASDSADTEKKAAKAGAKKSEKKS